MSLEISGVMLPRPRVLYMNVLTFAFLCPQSRQMTIWLFNLRFTWNVSIFHRRLAGVDRSKNTPGNISRNIWSRYLETQRANSKNRDFNYGPGHKAAKKLYDCRLGACLNTDTPPAKLIHANSNDHSPNKLAQNRIMFTTDSNGFHFALQGSLTRPERTK